MTSDVNQSSQTHTSERENPEETYLNLLDRAKFSDLVRYVLTGIVGFMIGYLYYYTTYLDYVGGIEPFVREVAGCTFLGAITFGIAFGLVSRSVIKALKLAVAGGIGFLIGGGMLYPIYLIIWFIPLVNFIMLTIIGMIGGIFIGIALWDIKKLVKMAIAGGLGLFIGAVVGISLINNILLAFMSYGIIVGAFLGAGMYFAEKGDVR